MPCIRRPIQDRFWEKVSKGRGCWIWTSTLNEHGYGTIGTGGHDGRMKLAHRVSWQIHFGKIPKGICVLHRCDNPKCINPSHLFLGTRADNNRDMEEKGRARKVGSKGEKNPASKLSESDVRDIRMLKKNTNLSNGKIGLRYGVHHSLISLIIRGHIWKHV